MTNALGITASKEGTIRSAAKRAWRTEGSGNKDALVITARGIFVSFLISVTSSPILVFSVGSPEPERVIKSKLWDSS